MASVSSHNLVVNKSNDFNRRVSQSPYSFKSRLNAPITVSFPLSSAQACSIFKHLSPNPFKSGKSKTKIDPARAPHQHSVLLG